MKTFYLLAILVFLAGFVPDARFPILAGALIAAVCLVLSYFILVALCVSGDPANKDND